MIGTYIVIQCKKAGIMQTELHIILSGSFFYSFCTILTEHVCYLW